MQTKVVLIHRERTICMESAIFDSEAITWIGQHNGIITILPIDFYDKPTPVINVAEPSTNKRNALYVHFPDKETAVLFKLTFL